MNNFYFC